MSPTASRASALRLSFLLLWRDLLARELNLLLVALLVAVAAVTTVGFFVWSLALLANCSNVLSA